MGEERSNEALNEYIESLIRRWDGTVTGRCLRNMYENGDSYEHIADFMNFDLEDFEDGT